MSRSGIITNDDALALSCSNVTVLQNGRLGISELNTTLFPLLKATSYMFEITAFTSAGEGPACQVNASTSDDGKRPVKLDNLVQVTVPVLTHLPPSLNNFVRVT